MNAVKTRFSIKDLESLGGVKAHTIRIWEKRYNLLEPKRTPTNIRYYGLSDLQKLLNVVFLLENKHKISKIAKHTKTELASLVQKIIEDKEHSAFDHAVNSLQMAMIKFDRHLFDSTIENLSEQYDFEKIFEKALVPLLGKIGVLWQTDTIDPAHEHFISTLVKQELLCRASLKKKDSPSKNSTTFVLFLPENEIHELGLMYLYYKLNKEGYECIYLGQSIQLSSLNYLIQNKSDLHFVSYFTVKPETEELQDYLKAFNETLQIEAPQLSILGRQTEFIEPTEIPENIHLYRTLQSFTQKL